MSVGTAFSFGTAGICGIVKMALDPRRVNMPVPVGQFRSSAPVNEMTRDTVVGSLFSTMSSDLEGESCWLWASTGLAVSSIKKPNATIIEYFITEPISPLYCYFSYFARRAFATSSAVTSGASLPQALRMKLVTSAIS